MPPAKPVPREVGAAALRDVQTAYAARTTPLRSTERTAVRWLLEEFARKAPGNAVEIRIPPHAAIQAVPGPGHKRGTPPAVVEMDAATWIALACGTASWADVLAQGRALASGQRTDLSYWLPVHVRPH